MSDTQISQEKVYELGLICNRCSSELSLVVNDVILPFGNRLFKDATAFRCKCGTYSTPKYTEIFNQAFDEHNAEMLLKEISG